MEDFFSDLTKGRNQDNRTVLKDFARTYSNLGKDFFEEELVKNWLILYNAKKKAQTRKVIDNLLDPDAALQKVNYLALNLKRISQNNPKCYKLYSENKKIEKIKDAQESEDLYKGLLPPKVDWATFVGTCQAHHIIPKTLLVPEKNNPDPVNAFMKYVEHYPHQLFDFNGLDNGIVLKRYSSTIKGLKNGVHASHDEYSRQIRNFLDQKYILYENQLKPKFSGAALEREIALELHKHVEKLRIGLKKVIIDHSINGTKTKVNKLPGLADFQNLLR